ncbi:glycine-rich cell wall structural protein-like [Phragmites australis]|uniref:glycine-rich cell wall structural protein-like n=1 Tax=Phragmites australis TaxID=29695 RepID=UPI002D797D07|nr:glycine-rich cell wall structural protein-like [Phragmites australis]
MIYCCCSPVPLLASPLNPRAPRPRNPDHRTHRSHLAELARYKDRIVIAPMAKWWCIASLLLCLAVAAATAARTVPRDDCDTATFEAATGDNTNAGAVGEAKTADVFGGSNGGGLFGGVHGPLGGGAAGFGLFGGAIAGAGPFGGFGGGGGLAWHLKRSPKRHYSSSAAPVTRAICVPAGVPRPLALQRNRAWLTRRA